MNQDERDALVVAVGRLDQRLQRAQKDLEVVKGILASTDSDDAAASATHGQDTTSPVPAQAKKDKKLIIRDPAIQDIVDKHRAAKEEQLRQREAEAKAEEDTKPRVAPYPVVIRGVDHDVASDKWSVTVFDPKYSESTMVPTDANQAKAIKAAMAKGQRLQFEMNEDELKGAEWLPDRPVTTLDEAVADAEASGMEGAREMGDFIQKTMNDIAGEEIPIVFDEGDGDEEN